MKLSLYVVKVEQPIKNDIFNFFMRFVYAEKRVRILKQRMKQNMDNMLVGEILAKIAIKQVFGINIAKQNFSYGEFGKPYLLGYPNIHFNISHSGKYVACAVSDKPIGIDIQQITAFDLYVAQRICSKAELEYIKQSNDKSSAFTKLWTQKEAILKMYGTGITNADMKSCLTNVKPPCIKIENYWLSISV